MTLEKTSSDTDKAWSVEITAKTRWWDIPLLDVWRYRDLLWLFVRRDFVAVYKQTILGPLWFVIQPLLTTLMFALVFSGVAGLSTDGHPPLLFYLAGTIPWNYFAGCLNRTSNTFVQNERLFGKVYFPRLIAPLSVVFSMMIQLAIQLGLFLCLWVYYLGRGTLTPNWMLLPVMLPVLILLMGVLGLGTGIVISSLTTKYRDAVFLVTFGVQLAMYATPVIYPMSAVPQRYAWFLRLNPMASIVESFRALFLGGPISWTGLAQSTLAALALLVLGLLLFNRVEKTFMDTV